MACGGHRFVVPKPIAFTHSRARFGARLSAFIMALLHTCRVIVLLFTRTLPHVGYFARNRRRLKIRDFPHHVNPASDR
jgi:hypothetical protein